MRTGDDAVVTTTTEQAPGRGRHASGPGPRGPGGPTAGHGGRGARTDAARAAAIAAGIAVGGVLFLAYLRVSWTVAAASDGAAQALQARDMLAGNWLLHGWTLSDVSFYPTELAEYVAVELVRPFGLGVIHVAAALTYTLLVLAVVALARGRAVGRAAVASGLLAGVIMLAPQLGYGAFVLLLSPDHVGTQVPLLLGWLLLDRAPRRWWVPATLCVLLAVVQFADRVALLTAVLPLIIVCLATLARRRPKSAFGLALAGPNAHSGRGRRRRSGACGADGRSEWALIWTGAGSIGLAWVAARALAAAGGFAAHPFPLTLAPLSLLWTHTWLTGWGILELYGANFVGVRGPAGLAFAALHLIGLTLALTAVGITLGRFLRPAAGRRPGGTASGALSAVAHRANRPLVPWPTAPIGVARWATAPEAAERCGPPRQTRGEVERAVGRGPETSGIDTVLAVAVVANLVSYLVSTTPGTVLGTGYDAREIAAVLPLGAVLAGRAFGPALAEAVSRAVSGLPRCRAQWSSGAESRDRSIPALLIAFIFFIAAAGYASALGYSAARPGRPGQESALAGWLVAHGLRYGLGQSSANVVTVDSGGRATLMPVTVRGGRVRPLLYQAAAAAYDPRLHDADFLVSRVPPAEAGEAVETVPAAAVRATFGPPARSYRFAGYTVLVWDVNLLTRMGR